MSKEKFTLVLLPGLNGTEGLFKPLIETAPENFSVVCISYPAHEKKTYAELTAYVLDRLNTIKGNYIVLGESFSGPISVFIANQKPPGLCGVILVATFVSSPSFRVFRFFPWKFSLLFTQPLISLIAFFCSRKTASILKAASAEVQSVSREVLAARIDESFTVNAEKALGGCEVPIRYFRGNFDFIVPQSSLNKILGIKSNIKVVRFHTHHFLLQSAPVEAWCAISDFAAELVSSVVN